METARSYIERTKPAAEGLFKLLNGYAWEKMRAFVEITKSRTRDDLDARKAEYEASDVAREVIAGSILQLAYFAIDSFAVFAGKSEGALHFESEINRVVREAPEARVKGIFSLPEKFCVGRDIGDLPLGMLVFAGRNQYNHYGQDRLSVVNEVVFNALHQMWPEPVNGRSFNLYDGKRFRSYSVLCALGWVANDVGTGYGPYSKDLYHVLKIEA
jgi:hypothetical protein